MAKLSMQKTVEGLGDYLREQRGQAQMSLRQLAELTDVSNPYLSQIERGLRRPSAEVLQQIAKALRISAESLYVRAGILDADESGARMVEDAIALDTRLTERQKTAMLDIYRSFVGHRRSHRHPTGRNRDRSKPGEDMTITDTINAQVKSIVEDVKGLPETLKKIDVADLQKQAQGLAQTAVGTATSAYADFAKKGEEFVNKAKGFKVDDIKKTVDS